MNAVPEGEGAVVGRYVAGSGAGAREREQGMPLRRPGDPHPLSFILFLPFFTPPSPPP